MTKVVFLARLIPAVSFDMVSYGSGLTKMSGLKFGAATFVGMLPLTFLYASFGSMFSVSRTVAWLGGAAMVTLMFVLPRWIERHNFLGLKRLLEHPEDPPEGMPAVNPVNVPNRRTRR